MVRRESVITNDIAEFSVIESAYLVIVQYSYLFSHSPCEKGFRQTFMLVTRLTYFNVAQKQFLFESLSSMTIAAWLTSDN